jgi:hypothetical protein
VQQLISTRHSAPIDIQIVLQLAHVSAHLLTRASTPPQADQAAGLELQQRSSALPANPPRISFEREVTVTNYYSTSTVLPVMNFTLAAGDEDSHVSKSLEQYFIVFFLTNPVEIGHSTKFQCMKRDSSHSTAQQ